MQRKTSNNVKYIIQYVLSELKQKLPSKYTYHNLSHTLDVMSVCASYSKVYHLDKKTSDLLTIAAACHDYGYIISAENHEMTSADMASMIMAAYQFKDRDIRLVRSMIMATKPGSSPSNLLDKIIADADLDYLGRDDYPEISKRLYTELVKCGKIDTKKTWIDLQIEFLQKHHYHTDFAIEHRRPVKLNRIEQLLDKKHLLAKTGRLVEAA